MLILYSYRVCSWGLWEASCSWEDGYSLIGRNKGKKVCSFLALCYAKLQKDNHLWTGRGSALRVPQCWQPLSFQTLELRKLPSPSLWYFGYRLNWLRYSQENLPKEIILPCRQASSLYKVTANTASASMFRACHSYFKSLCIRKKQLVLELWNLPSNTNLSCWQAVHSLETFPTHFSQPVKKKAKMTPLCFRFLPASYPQERVLTQD